MIKSVTVVNHLGESFKLDLASPEKSGFIVKSIDKKFKMYLPKQDAL